MTQIGRFPDLYEKGQKRPVPASALQQTTVHAGKETTIWARKCQQDEALWWGHGPHERDRATAFVGLDLVASGNGTGAAGDAVNGEVVLAITDSRQNRVKASVTFESVAQLRDALQEDRTNRLIMEAMAPYAKPGRHLEIRLNADAGSDGVEIDPAASSGTLYHTQQA